MPATDPRPAPATPPTAAGSDNRIVALFHRMQALAASDLFLTEGKRPFVRVYGQIQPLDEPEVTRAEFHDFLVTRLAPGVADRLDQQLDLDVGFSLSETDRFRLNLCFQKGRLTMVARRVPLGSLSFEQLRLPAVIKTFAETPRG